MSFLQIAYLVGMATSGTWILWSGQRNGLRNDPSLGFSILLWPFGVLHHFLRLAAKSRMEQEIAETDDWFLREFHRQYYRF